MKCTNPPIQWLVTQVCPVPLHIFLLQPSEQPLSPIYVFEFAEIY